MRCFVHLPKYYRIRPYYRTLRLGFSKLLEKLAVKYPPYKGKLQTKLSRGLYEERNNNAYYFLIFFVKTYVVGTRLNCLGVPRQFKGVPTTYVFINK